MTKVKPLTMAEARAYIKHTMKELGYKLSHYSAEQITEAARRLAQDASVDTIAKVRSELRRSAAVTRRG
jgi:hypothetical protein